MELRVLGRLQIIDQDGDEVDLRGDRVRALLAMLLERPDEVRPADALVEALWGETPPATARSALRMHASRLRQRLGPVEDTGIDVVSQASGYRLAVAPECVDHVRFEQLVDQARADLGIGRADEAVSLLEEALASWRGIPFADLDLPGLTAAVQHLRARHVEAQELLFATRLARGESSELIADLEAAASAHPEQERLTRHLMLALYRAGRQSDALATYQRQRSWLADELGLTPSRELVDLEAAILRQDLDLDIAAPEVAAPVVSGGAGVRRPAPGPTVPTLPSSLAAACRGPFVGRHDEIETLTEALGPESLAGSAPLHCVLGPAGIGKSRLVAEVAGAVARSGVAVLHGWALPGATLPFSTLRSAIAPLASWDSPVAGAAASVLDLIDADAEPTPRRRTQLFALVDRLIDTICAERSSVLLVLDDVQWADSITLATLHHLARRSTRGLGLIVASRTGEPLTPWTHFFSELSTIPGAVVLELHGLDVDAATELVGAHDPDGNRRRHRRVAEHLVAATRGNAFHLTEVINGYLEDQRDDHPVFLLDAPRVPASASAALERRVAELPQPTVELLRTAAVLGSTFEVETLAATAEASPGSVETELLAAMESGVVAESPDDPDRLVFDHDLLRRSLLDDLTPTRRRQLHAAVASTLGERGADPITVAYHHYRALPLTEASDVIESLREAARHALALTGWSEAHTIASVGLDLWTPDVSTDRRRVELLTMQGRARMGLESREAAMPCFEQALDLALDGDHVDLVDQVLLGASTFYAALTPGDPVSHLIDRALADGRRTAVGVHALAGVAIQRFATEGATREIVGMIDHLRSRVDDPDEHPALLRAELYLAAGDPGTEAALAKAASVRASSGGSCSEPTLEWCDATLFEIGFALRRGDVVAARSRQPEFEQGAHGLGYPVFQWLVPVIRSDLALQAGRFDEAANEVAAALSFGTEHGVPDAPASHAFHQLITTLLRGGTEAMVPIFEEAAQRFPVLPFEAGRLVTRSALDPMSVRREIDQVIDGLETGAPGFMTALSTAFAAWAALDLADREVADRLLPLVEPWTGTVPRTALVGASVGPMDRLLGRLECLVGDTAAGCDHLQRAVELADGMGARPWSAWCRHDLACETTDPDLAARRWDEARVLAAELRMAPLLARIDSVR